MDYESRYNVYNAAGEVVYAPGAPIDEAEAVRQGIVPLPEGKQLVFEGEIAVLQDAPASDEQASDSTPQEDEADDDAADNADDADGHDAPVGSQARPKRRA